MNVHTPQAPVDADTVREFVRVLHEAAAAAFEGIDNPGVLQLIRLWPDDKSATAISGRFQIGDIDGMAQAAIWDAEAGHNVYCEGRTVPSDSTGTKRGDLQATRGVFALVIDSDADKNREADLGDIEPSLSVETSPGNRHHWFFLEPAMSGDAAQSIGTSIRKATGADDDTGNPVQPYRVAGTPNYPSPKKQGRGRIVTPTSIVTEGRSYFGDDLAEIFEAEPTVSQTPGPDAAPPETSSARSLDQLLASLSAKRRADLEAKGLPDRSAHFLKVTGWLKGDGYSQSEVFEIWQHFVNGAGYDKYGARLANEVWRAWHKTSDLTLDEALSVTDGLRKSVEPQDRPVDLWAKFDPPELPAGLLPSVIEEFARVEGEMMGADPGGLAAAALAVCAAAIPDRIQIQVKRHDEHWTESARLWVALIGSPSTKKSPILSQAVRPLTKIDARLWREFADASARFERLSKDEKQNVSPPKQVRLRIEDATIEAAQEVLKDSPEGVLCLQDELSGWFGSIDKYSGSRGSAKDRGFWLQAFNGGTYAINRIGRGSSFIDNLSVSMLGGIQPDPLRKIASESVDDGLLQRLFPIILRPATMGKDEPVPDVVAAYGTMVERLHSMRPPSVGGIGNLSGVLPTTLRFDDAAQEIRRDLEHRHLHLMSSEAVNKKLAAHIGKYDGIFARLCILWHCVESSGLPHLPPIITEDVARRVADFLHRFLLPHAVAFYAGMLGLSDDHDRLTAVAGYILAHKKDKVTNRDIQRGDRTMKALSRQDTQRIFEQLDAFGWLDPTPGARPSDPLHWVVNPECHRLFAERAEQEGIRRKAARELIAEIAGTAT